MPGISIPSHESSARANSRWLAALLLLAFLLYANTLFNGFVDDDAIQILENPYVRSFRNLGQIFTTTVCTFQGKEGITNYYRPLMTSTYLVGHALFGELPYGYHLLNVLLSVVVVWLVYAVALQIFRDEAPSLVAAAIFALHPIHTEVVDWISSITEIELALFYLLAFLFFLRLEGVDHGRAARLQFGMLSCFALGLLSKEQTLTLPLLATAYEHWVRADREQTSWKTKVSRYAGFWAIGAAYLAARATLLGGFIAVVKHPDVTWPLVPLSALALTAQYAQKLFWPWPLSFAYPFQKSVSLEDPRVLAGLAIVLAAAALFIHFWKTSRANAFAVFWIFFTLAPVLNARWMAYSVYQERYAYLPSVGFCWLLAGGIVWLWRWEGTAQRARRAAVALVAFILALAASTAVLARNREWADERVIYERTLAVYPNATSIRSNLGTWNWNRGNSAEAERLWRQVLFTDPGHSIALSNLGLAMFQQGRPIEADGYLKRAIELRPQFAAPHVHLAKLYATQGRKAEAEAEFRRAIELAPLSTATRNSFGTFLLQEGRLPEAEGQFRASVESIPTEDGWAGLGDAYTRLNRPAQAEQAWKEVTRLNPFDSRAHFALGKIYFAAGHFTEAERELRAGLQMDPNNSEARAQLDELLAKMKPEGRK